MHKIPFKHIAFALWTMPLLLLVACRQTPSPPSVTATSALVAEAEHTATPVQAYPLDAEPTSTPISAYPVETQATSTPRSEAYPAPEEANPTPDQTSTQENEAFNENELAQAINQQIIDVVSASEALRTTTAEALEDETITQEEVERLITDAESLVLATEEANLLIENFNDQFGGLASDSLPKLQTLQETLGMLADNISSIETMIETIQSSLESGSIDQESINELQSLAEDLANQDTDLQPQVEAWLVSHQDDIQARASEILETEPTKVAESLEETNEMTVSFVTELSQILADNKITEEEFNTIAQDSANLLASLEANGGPQAPLLTTLVESLVSQVAAGNFNEVAQSILGLRDLLDLPAP